MSLIKQISDIARDLAGDLQKGTANAEAELVQIEKQRAAVMARLDLGRLAQKRLSEFRPEIGAQYQCPQCWIIDERRSALRPIPGTVREDMFRCSFGHEYTVPA